MLKPLLIILGTLSLILGVIGILVPGLPTTPFLLLSASLYIRSSRKLYYWLINHKYFGRYIRTYRKQGINKQTLVYALLLMWIMISISTFVIIEHLWIKVLLVTIGLTGTIVMYIIFKRRNGNLK